MALFSFRGKTTLIGSLVDTQTTDGLQLHGFLSETTTIGPLWILVHGVNSNFYSSSLLKDTALTLQSLGQSTLLVNTRGHDILGFNTGNTPARVGSQVESLSNSCLDIDAWMELARQTNHPQINLLGHSLGALKCVLWAARTDTFKGKLVCLSPPRLNTELLLSDPKRGELFRETLSKAKDFCDEGREDHVMKVRFPLPMWISAGIYLDKYGSGEKYDYLQKIHQLNANCLWTFGELEVSNGSLNFYAADSALTQKINEFPIQAAQAVQVIPHGDHSYNLARPELATVIREWLAQLDD